MEGHLTDHARIRMQQRGIRPDAVEALLSYGRIARVDGGRTIVFFDKKARTQLAKQDPAAARAGKRLCSTYAIVESDGLVITVGHRYRRIPRE